MFEAIKKNYWQMFDDTRADELILNGEAMYTLWERKEQYGIEKVHRDGFHADYGIGRYLLALTLWGSITKIDVRHNTFDDFDVDVTPTQAEICRQVTFEVAYSPQKDLPQGIKIAAS